MINSPPPPIDGWLKTARRSAGLSLQAVADRLNVSPQAVHQFEKSEVAGTLSLRQLQNVASAIGFKVTYTLVASTGRAADGDLAPTAVLQPKRPLRVLPKPISPAAASAPPPVSLDRFSITSD